jgi:hypothetical protein
MPVGQSTTTTIMVVLLEPIWLLVASHRGVNAALIYYHRGGTMCLFNKGSGQRRASLFARLRPSLVQH